MSTLDRLLGGGFAPGSVVALVTPAAAQVDPLLAAFVADRDVCYLSTERPAGELRRQYDTARGRFDVGRTSADDLLAAPEAALDSAAQELVVVDPVNALEGTGDEARYRAFLDAVKRRVDETGGIALLHCVEMGSPDLRDRTLYRADAVCHLVQTVDATAVTTSLVVPKHRGGRPLLDPVKLDLTDRVRVDTSRDI
ncbi:RAD55 family ATPase [Halomarina ordinaria]|uniref:RAD55 family ATPase n=1 Tax=Halomarina ordinaria TaxID=3033939 RepID=A0ABD5UGC5_9EURY|nr:transcriptional regulator [Halomarina sp. PSRA2]